MWESSRIHWPGEHRRNPIRAKFDFKTNDRLERCSQLLVDAEKQLKFSSKKEATLLLGPSDSDKTSVALSLAGLNNALMEMEKSITNRTSSGEKIDHLLPIMYVNSETNHVFYDMPDFKKGREFSEDIAVSILMGKVARNCQQIKIVLIMDFESCNMKSVDTNRFNDLLTHVTTFLKTTTSNELAEFVSLVVTKAPIDIESAEENSKTSVIQFLEHILDQVQKEPNGMAKTLLQILLSSENNYGHIEVFSSPIDLIRLRNQVNNLTHFISTDSVVFGSTISAETFVEIEQIKQEINEVISNAMKQVGAVLAQVYQSIVTRKGRAYYHILREEMQFHLMKLTQGVTNIMHSENPQIFFQNILLALESVNIEMPLKHYFTIRTQIDYLDWLEHLSPSVSVSTPNQWVQPLRSTSQLVDKYRKWFQFLTNLNDLFSSDTTRLNRENYNVDVLNQMRRIRITDSNYQEFLEILANKTNLSEIPMEVAAPNLEFLEALNEVLHQTIPSGNHYACERNDVFRSSENPSDTIMNLVEEYKLLANKRDVTSDQLSKFVEKVKRMENLTNAQNDTNGEQLLLRKIHVAATTKWNTLYNVGTLVLDIAEVINDIATLFAEKEDAGSAIVIVNETAKYTIELENELGAVKKILQSLTTYSITDSYFTEIYKSTKDIFNEVIKLQEQTQTEINTLEIQRSKLKGELFKVIFTKSAALVAAILGCFKGQFKFIGVLIKIAVKATEMVSENDPDWLEAIQYANDQFKEISNLVGILTKEKIKVLKSEFRRIRPLLEQQNETFEEKIKLENLQRDFEDEIAGKNNGKVDSKKINEIENELKETMQEYVQKFSEDQIKKRRSKRHLIAIIGVIVVNALDVGYAIYDLVDSVIEHQQLIDEVTHMINAERATLNKLKKIEEEIYQNIYPILESLSETLAGLATSRSPNKAYEDVIIEIVKLNIPEKMRHLKSAVSKTCNEANIEHDYIEAFKKFDFAIEHLLSIFAVVQRIKFEKENLESISEINEQQTKGYLSKNITDTKLRTAIYEMEEAIKINLIIEKYNSVINPVKMAVFPNAIQYLFSFHLPEQISLRDFSHVLFVQMDGFHNQWRYAQQVLTQEANDLSSTYISEDNPLYEWTYEPYGSEIDKILSGDTVYLKADAKQNFEMQAVKVQQVELNFAFKKNSPNIPKETVLAMSKLVQLFNYHLKHSGFSQYRCGNRFYTMKHPEIDIVQSFEKNDSNKSPVYYNDEYRNMSKNSFLISPFTFWEIRLVPQDPNSSNFSSLKPLIGFFDLQLLGRAQYLEWDAKICGYDSDLLDNYYIPDDIQGEMLQNDIYRIRKEKFDVDGTRSAYPLINMRYESPADSENLKCQSQSLRVPRSLKKIPELIADDHDYKKHESLARSSAPKTYSPINTFFNAVLLQFIIVEFISYLRQAKVCFVDFITPLFQHAANIENRTFFKYENNFESLPHERIGSVNNDFRLNARQCYDMVDNALILAPIAVNYTKRFLGYNKIRRPTKFYPSEDLEMALMSSYVHSVIKRGEKFYRD